MTRAARPASWADRVLSVTMKTPVPAGKARGRVSGRWRLSVSGSGSRVGPPSQGLACTRTCGGWSVGVAVDADQGLLGARLVASDLVRDVAGGQGVLVGVECTYPLIELLVGERLAAGPAALAGKNAGLAACTAVALLLALGAAGTAPVPFGLTRRSRPADSVPSRALVDGEAGASWSKTSPPLASTLPCRSPRVTNWCAAPSIGMVGAAARDRALRRRAPRRLHASSSTRWCRRRRCRARRATHVPTPGG